MRRILTHGAKVAVLFLSPITWAATAQVPLHLSSTPDPNVLINMSVETPMGGAAYNDQLEVDESGNTVCGGRVSRDSGDVGICYSGAKTYLGYFDPDKCYTYDTATTPNRFVPAAAATNRTCTGQFSGNFMNWATMTAMDMFALTMTGGNRIVDTTSETVVRRMRKTNNDGWFPHKYLSSSDNVAPSTVTPFTDSEIFIYNTDFGVQFGRGRGDSDRGTFDLAVKVCDSTAGLEANCVTIGSAIKPVGRIQQNADHMRFGVTSFSLDGSRTRNGGILRSNMKYVGATMPDGSGGTMANPLAEINANGLFLNNPNASDATASGVSNSGVINYLNKFSDSGYKSLDPASELYYESIRYFKNLGRTPEYANSLSSAQLGGFPAVTTWEDPIQYSCQKNFILGINDANPWLDKRLPGTYFTETIANQAPFNSRANILDDVDPPADADPDINVRQLTNQVGELEGLNGTSQCIGCTATTCDGLATNKTITALGEVMGTCPSPNKQNSYYIAGLAYYANTQDIRADLSGKQTITSFFIDTQEFQANPLVGRMNMLWLAGKYGGFIDSNNNGEPDLTTEWDSDGDGEPDNYVLASRPDKLVRQLNANFADIEERSSSASAVTTSSTRLNTSSTIYQARFNSGDWTGQLLAFAITSSGAVGSQQWDAAAQMPAHGARNVLSWNGTSGFVFDGTTANLATINSIMASASASSVTPGLVNYLRGDDTNEQSNGGLLRDRISRLGDIVNSDPIFVSNENYGYTRLPGTEGTSYASFRSLASYSSRSKMVYVGANDGMLHGFNAASGVELMAYVPKAVYPNLASLADPNYSHKFYVDGSPQVGDAYFDVDGDGSKEWRTVLVGTTGAGGSGVFALDITAPDSFGAGNVLWDIDASDANFADLGDTIGSASIARMPDGHFYAVFSNGFNSGTGNAVIYLARLGVPGAPTVFKLDTHTSANGMTAPLVVDSDGDRIVDAIYAGDLQGNLWKAEWLPTPDPNDAADAHSWQFSFGTELSPQPLFSAADGASVAQPITAKPQTRNHPAGGTMVYFGTGKYFENNDNIVGVSPQVQTFYGVRDQGSQVSGKGQLLQQSILGEGAIGSFNVRATTNLDISTEKGWYMDLIVSGAASSLGERVVDQPQLIGDRVLFTTILPSTDPCAFGGSSWLMNLDALSGARIDRPTFDVDNDGVYSASDELTIDINGTPTQVPVTGLQQSGLGLISSPALMRTGAGEITGFMGGSGNSGGNGNQGGGNGVPNIGKTTMFINEDSGRQSWQQLQ
ncbi:pilus assembly protein [Motiliproteus sediminis]|uniref:pilus assembly protein n=1 Tax=Motiliproteus sediminis TaxID=1468178 RepID=UPI001AEF5A31|nr:PilC/PilY family type IV pilus protein [Motiliproteus sediminis]